MVSAAPGKTLAECPRPTRVPPEQPHASPHLREAVAGLPRLPALRDATQAVFGEGAAHAEVMLVGEQPGDQEDLAGRPFVGPAGRLLDEALAEAGIDRSRRLRHERRQALQVAGAGQAAHPPEADMVGVSRLQALARGGARRRPAAGGRRASARRRRSRSSARTSG